MKIAIIGSGNIGSNVGLRAAQAGHEVHFSYARSDEKLAALASQAGPNAVASSVEDATEPADVILFAVPWDNRLEVFPTGSSLAGKIVIDATNQFGRDGLQRFEGSAISQNFPLFQGAHVAKAFNTLTSGFQESELTRAANDHHAMFFAGEVEQALDAAQVLISAVGFVPVHIGGWDVVELMEAPRRDGSVYGEAYLPEDAERIAKAATSNLQTAAELANELKLPG